MSAKEGNIRYIEELERNGDLNSEQAELQRQKYNQENKLPDFQPYELNHQQNIPQNPSNNISSAQNYESIPQH